jgi:aspartate aminotransferase
VIPPAKDMTLNLKTLEKTIDAHTKGVILNSPNNPSGVVYPVGQIKALSDILSAKSKEYGTHIFVIADEPYREIVYDGATVPYLMNYYDDTVVCYSYSKSLSLPGERIGYIAVCPKACAAAELYYAICGAGRSLGYVCAPSMFQRTVAKCVKATSDISAYEKKPRPFVRLTRKIRFRMYKASGRVLSFRENPRRRRGRVRRKREKNSDCCWSRATVSASRATSA